MTDVVITHHERIENAIDEALADVPLPWHPSASTPGLPRVLPVATDCTTDSQQRAPPPWPGRHPRDPAAGTPAGGGRPVVPGHLPARTCASWSTVAIDRRTLP